MKRRVFFLLFLLTTVILFAKTYKVGIYDNPPLCFIEKDEAKGFYIDVLNDIADKESFDFDYQLYTFKDACDLLEAGRLDLVVAMGKTDERELLFDFNAQPFMSSWAEIYTNRENFYNTFVDLAGKSVGLLKRGIFGQRFVKEMALYSLNFSPKYFDSYTEILTAIDRNEIDAGVVNRFSKPEWKAVNSLGKAVITFSPIEVFAGLNKEISGELIPLIDQYLTKMRENEDSVYYDYIRKWLKYDTKEPFQYAFHIVIFLLIIIVVLSIYLIYNLIQKLNRNVVEFKSLSEDFKTILNSIGDAVIWTDLNGRIQGMNPPASELTGWKIEEAVGEALHTVISIRNYHTKEKMTISFDEVVKRKDIFQISGEFELISKAGTCRIIDDSVAPILNTKGEINGIVVVFRDITEKRKNEMRLADSEKRFRTFVDSFPATVFMKDSDLKLVFVNRYLEENFIEVIDEWYGKTIAEIFPGEEGAKMFESDIESLNSNLTIREEKQLNKYGELRYLKTYKFPIEKEDGEKYLGGFSFDITELKQAMKDLELAKQEAEKANNMKDIFLANINHEIRTPLNGIKGILHLFERKGLSKSQMEYISMLEYSADRLKRLVDDILDFSKLNLDRIKIEKRPVQMEDMCKVIYSEYIKQAGEKGLTFTCRYLNPEINNILIDPLRFEQILHNLLSNAIKFTDEGSVTLTGEYIALDTESGILKIEIADTGIGMSQETVEKIFDYFYQGDQSYTKKFQGTGIGMALVKRLLDLMEGEIHIESFPNEGTRYIISVPVDLNKKLSGTPFQALEQAKKRYMGKKFLIVEDDKINRLIMKKALQKTDAIILEAENGKTALEIIRNKRPDLVLMDIQMPDISGVEVIKTIRNSNDAIKNTKIVAVSGYSQEKEINAFLDAGADDFISKPVENRKLFEIIFKNLS